MAEARKKPHYGAVLLSPSGEDLGPVDITDANDDIEAGNHATDRGGKWMGANGVDRATVQIVKDGKGIRSIPLEVHH